MDVSTNLFGDTPYGVWLGEVLNDCIRQDGARVTVQMNFLVQKVKAEPECAQFAIQLLAQEIESDQSKLRTWRMPLGAIMVAYQVYRHHAFGAPFDEYPPELAEFIRLHPVVVDCFTYAADRIGG